MAVTTTPAFERGRVYLRKPLPPDNKPRLVVIVSRNELNQGSHVTVVPITSQQIGKRTQSDYCVFLPAGCSGNDYDCVEKCDAVAPLDKLQIDRSIGTVPKKRMQEIDAALKWVLNLS